MKFIAYLTIGIFIFGGILIAEEKDSLDKKSPDKKQTEKKEYKKRKASNPEIVIQTDFGTMKLELFRDVAPAHVDSTLARIRDKFYDGLIFHRVIDGFMIQGGDPKGNGTGGAEYNLPDEFSKLKHLEGTFAMGHKGFANSASCQFYICLAPQPHLDGKYTIFGHLMEGYDVLHKIGKVEVNQRAKPLKDVYIRKMYIEKEVESEKGKEVEKKGN